MDAAPQAAAATAAQSSNQHFGHDQLAQPAVDSSAVPADASLVRQVRDGDVQTAQQSGEEVEVHNLAASGDLKSQAIRIVQDQGVGVDIAQEAVEQTEDVFVSLNAYTWAEAAMLWIAEENEHRAERDKLADAMAASLAEAERRKAAEAPLHERPEPELLQRFRNSVLLPLFRATLLGGALFDPPVHAPLISLLELERQCCVLWYPGPGTRKYFQELGSSCTEAVPPPPRSPSPESDACDAADAGRRSKRKRKPSAKAAGSSGKRPAAATTDSAAASAAAGDAQAAAGGPGSAADAAGGCDYMQNAEAGTAWAAVLSQKVQYLREQLAWLPEAAGEAPPFLRPHIQAAGVAAPGGEEDECLIVGEK